MLSSTPNVAKNEVKPAIIQMRTKNLIGDYGQSNANDFTSLIKEII